MKTTLGSRMPWPRRMLRLRHATADARDLLGSVEVVCPVALLLIKNLSVNLLEIKKMKFNESVRPSFQVLQLGAEGVDTACETSQTWCAFWFCSAAGRAPSARRHGRIALLDGDRSKHDAFGESDAHGVANSSLGRAAPFGQGPRQREAHEYGTADCARAVITAHRLAVGVAPRERVCPEHTVKLWLGSFFIPHRAGGRPVLPLAKAVRQRIRS